MRAGRSAFLFISLNATLASIEVLVIGFVHRDTPNELHFHRLEDMESKKVKEFIQEDRVVSRLLSLHGYCTDPPPRGHLVDVLAATRTL